MASTATLSLINPAATSPVAFFKALSEPTRLLSLLLIQSHGELCVCELMRALQQPQTKVSRHLSHLRQVGLLCGERRGQWVFYRLAALPEWMQVVLRETHAANPTLLGPAIGRLAASDRPSCC
ncbi:ArsR/SmtB family transcription factor [Marinimicrobium alkaliphilum]|uniref:ArsR/SmtB family transcription factor n=1 Tax=Marinimicrobium alkaliphilum TaxID=2202654 RepID=UPI000DBACCE8|nr:metalloregulator ArsR/SmtB family transcription factor [Marinimicrobium alkaliphilum]